MEELSFLSGCSVAQRRVEEHIRSMLPICATLRPGVPFVADAAVNGAPSYVAHVQGDEMHRLALSGGDEVTAMS